MILPLEKKRSTKGPPIGPKCYECQGFGHVAHECVNKLKKKATFKANITWDYSDSKKSEEEYEDNKNFIAFGASLHSCSSNRESSEESDDGETDKDESVHELREKYDQLYKESLKIDKKNLKLVERYKKSDLELAMVKRQVEELRVSIFE